MVYVYITDELLAFESDIRDLCMAFFPFVEIIYVRGNKEIAKHRSERAKEQERTDYMGQVMNLAFSNILDKKRDVIVEDYFVGNILDGVPRIETKSEIKRQLYNYLSKLTGKDLLWGTLTGIRPVTIATSFLEAKDLPEDSKNIYKSDYKKFDGNLSKYFKEAFYVNKKKIKELTEIANNEIQILKRKKLLNYKNEYSIYVGVPFCKSTCLYCSFTSFNIDKYKDYVKKYLDRLEKEMKDELHWDRFAPSSLNNNKRCYSPLTLYIGGGTPTSLSEDDFERLLCIIDTYINKNHLVEYTIEAGRPDTITEKKLVSMKKHGVTRISINPQSMNQKTLDLIGRKHTVNDIIEKFNLARSLGFDNINMDIILGLPNEHLFDVIKTLNSIRKLSPDSFTVHSLALKRAARLNYELDSWTKNYYLAGIKNVEEMNKMFKCSEVLAHILKLKPYYLYRQKNMAGNLENVGYAKDGKECIYNIMMMSERHTVYGFGCATTKEVFYEGENKRIQNTEGYKSVIDYCNQEIL